MLQSLTTIIKMKSIYYKQENGSLGIIAFFNESAVDEKIEQLKKDGIPFGEITDSVKIDDFFFDAYTVSEEGGIVVNFKKAKEIQKNKWRGLRAALLESLDIEFMRAIEAGDTIKQDEIKSQKQVLRDVTSIELPDSLEEIKNTIPEILKANGQDAIYSISLDENGVEMP